MFKFPSKFSLPCLPGATMDDRRERQRRMSVPEFGAWNQKATVPTDYSMVFSRARAERKRNKSDITDLIRTSLGNEQELIAANRRHHHRHHHNHHHHPRRQHHHQNDTVLRKKNILTYVNCCIRP